MKIKRKTSRFSVLLCLSFGIGLCIFIQPFLILKLISSVGTLDDKKFILAANTDGSSQTIRNASGITVKPGQKEALGHSPSLRKRTLHQLEYISSRGTIGGKKLILDTKNDKSLQIIAKRNNIAVMLTQEVFNRSASLGKTPNLYQLKGKPSQCGEYFKCYDVCHLKMKKKTLSKRVVFSRPEKDNESSTFIPRIVHQSWFESITEKEYPKLSKAQNSWKSLEEYGWQYKFYNDTEAEEFISKHFPPEVREAFDVLIPGAYKSDLFHYCALFIEGGLWADIDFIRKSDLEFLIKLDTGFIASTDNGEGLLQSAFLLAAPGHPFLAKAIELSVNMIRNRFTIFDISGLFCPSPKDVLRVLGSLFLTGPGLLGMAVNTVLGRHKHTNFYPGFLCSEKNNNYNIAKSKTVTRIVADDRSIATGSGDCHEIMGNQIPGKVLILAQNTTKPSIEIPWEKKPEIHQHRYFYVEGEKWIAVAEMGPKEIYDKKSNKPHYTQAMHIGAFGTYGVYKNYNIADEDIQILLK